MRRLLPLVVGVMFAPLSTAQEKNVDKPVMPSVDAKEWVKQKSGLEIWDSKEGKGDAGKGIVRFQAKPYMESFINPPEFIEGQKKAIEEAGMGVCTQGLEFGI